MTALLAQSKVHAEQLIARLIKECAEGISNREDEAVKLAALWQLDVKEVCAGFAEARELWRDARAQARLPAVVPARMPLVAWNDLLEAMNEQHAIIDNVGGKTVIASWEPSSLDPSRRVWVFQNKESFLLRYSNRFAHDRNLRQAWRKHPITNATRPMVAHTS